MGRRRSMMPSRKSLGSTDDARALLDMVAALQADVGALTKEGERHESGSLLLLSPCAMWKGGEGGGGLLQSA